MAQDQAFRHMLATILARQWWEVAKPQSVCSSCWVRLDASRSRQVLEQHALHSFVGNSDQGPQSQGPIICDDTRLTTTVASGKVVPRHG